MKKEKDEIESIITNQLIKINSLKNEIESKELEKNDMFREIILGIVDIADTFERVEEGLLDRGLNKNVESIKVQERYKSVHKRVLSLLSKYGVTKLEYPDNRLIVGFSRIVETEPDSARRNDEIISIVRNGYIRGSELIREAELIVVKN